MYAGLIRRSCSSAGSLTFMIYALGDTMVETNGRLARPYCAAPLSVAVSASDGLAMMRSLSPNRSWNLAISLLASRDSDHSHIHAFEQVLAARETSHHHESIKGLLYPSHLVFDKCHNLRVTVSRVPAFSARLVCLTWSITGSNTSRRRRLPGIASSPLKRPTAGSSGSSGLKHVKWNITSVEKQGQRSAPDLHVAKHQPSWISPT